MDAELAFNISSKIVAFAAFFATCEFLFLRRAGEFRAGGIWDLRISGSLGSLVTSAPLFSILFQDRVVAGALIVRLLCAPFLLVLNWTDPAFLPLIAVLASSQLYLNFRIRYGDDGSDQMLSLAIVVLAICRINWPSEVVIELGLIFLAAQGTLSYFCSGAAKLLGPLWRNGEALRSIMNHHTYGNRSLYSFLSKHRRMGRLMTWSVVGFQIAFPLIWITPPPYHMLWLIGALMFHLGIAVFMRLNGFLMIFPVTYPAIYVCHGWLF